MTRTSAPDLASLGQLLASEARAAMLLALLDGRAWTPSELARGTGVGRPTATEHADRLVASGLVTEVRQGRHRYLRLADARVAEGLEAFAALSGQVRPAESTLRAQRADEALRAGRSCYRHLAGRLGVGLCDGMRARGFITDEWQLAPDGRRWLTGLGVALPSAPRRPLVRPCLDWTERRDHLAGVAADALMATLIEHRFLEKRSDSRAVRVTAAGERELGWLLSRAGSAGRAGGPAIPQRS